MGLILTKKADQKKQDGSSRTLCGSWSVGAKDDHTGRGPGGKKTRPGNVPCRVMVENGRL